MVGFGFWARAYARVLGKVGHGLVFRVEHGFGFKLGHKLRSGNGLGFRTQVRVLDTG